MTDIQRLGGECDPLKMIDEQTAVVTGRGAVASLRDYAQEVASYSRGRGSFSVSPAGYGLCHNAEEVVLQSGYRAESDLDNPTGSVFCAGGSAIYVSWDEVDERAHTASYLAARQTPRRPRPARRQARGQEAQATFLPATLPAARMGETQRQRKRSSTIFSCALTERASATRICAAARPPPARAAWNARPGRRA